MKSYALGLLLLGSFNVLGKECAIKTSNQSTYTIKSSVYSYSNDINICKCQAGYKFSPSVSGGKLSKEGGKDDSFTVPLGLAGKELQCVTAKDDIALSTAEWVVPVSVLAVATGVVGSYSIYKLKSLNNPISEGDGEELGRVNPSNVQESQVRLESTYSVARDNIPEAPDLIEGHYAQVSDYVRGESNWSRVSIDQRPMQPLPETADYEEHIYAEPYAQPELVVESIEKKLDKETKGITTESSELPKNITANPNLSETPPLPPREYREVMKNLDSDSDSDSEICN